jgi:hypothetical protein
VELTTRQGNQMNKRCKTTAFFASLQSSALALAFAWSPAVDLVGEILRLCRGSVGSENLLLALATVVARFGIAKYAFAARSPKYVAVRRAFDPGGPTVGPLLGGSLRKSGGLYSRRT